MQIKADASGTMITVRPDLDKGCVVLIVGSETTELSERETNQIADALFQARRQVVRNVVADNAGLSELHGATPPTIGGMA
jgi:hypothetical protein